MEISKAKELVNTYGTLLKANNDPMGIYDVKILPASKKDLKEALLMCVKLDDGVKMKKALGVAYISLSNFQDDLVEGLKEIQPECEKLNAQFNQALRECYE
jgi:uncharacterized protein with GYD domain